MQLTHAQRRALQDAYASAYGRSVPDADAEALGVALLDVFGPLLLRADVHRSEPAPVDEAENKREPTRPI